MTSLRKLKQRVKGACLARAKLGARTKVVAVVLVLAVSVVAAVGLGFRAHAALACTPVLTSKGTLYTAAMNAPSGSTIDASGCDIGDYIFTSQSVSSVTVHDATYYGIFVDGGGALSTGPITVSITGAKIYNIGDHTGACTAPTTSTACTFHATGSQHGIGLRFDSGTGSAAHAVYGTVATSNIYSYQKGGIVINYNSNVTTIGNLITGLGPADFIAQNGIQYSRDAVGTIQGNTVSGNFYTGQQGVLADSTSCGPGHAISTCPPGRLYVSVGLLLFDIDPNNIHRSQNDLSDNQRPALVITDSPTG
jgi:hypothetical protein